MFLKDLYSGAANRSLTCQLYSHLPPVSLHEGKILKHSKVRTQWQDQRPLSPSKGQIHRTSPSVNLP